MIVMSIRMLLRRHRQVNNKGVMNNIVRWPTVNWISIIAMERRGSQGWTRVLLKGQMRYIQDIDSIVFLCSPL